MSEATVFLDTDDGHRIAVHHWPCPGEARGTLHWLHGMAEHGARYENLARAVNAAGWHLVSHDHRGHGRSVRDEAERGHFGEPGSWEEVVNDVERVQEWIADELPRGHRVLGGHSMGSFVALDYAERNGPQLDALILCGSDYHSPWFYRLMRVPIRVEYRRHGGRGVSRLIRALTFGAWAKKIRQPRTEFDWLSSRREAVDAYIDDPWCGHDCSTGLWMELIGALARIHHRRALARLPDQLPVLVIGGEADPMSNNGRGAKALLKALLKSGKPAEGKFFAGGRHEILNDHCADEVESTITAFLERVQ